MEHLELSYDGRHYNYKYSTNVEMEILGFFLSRGAWLDVALFKEWAIANKEDPQSKFSYGIGANITYLEEDEGYIFVQDTACKEKNPLRLKMFKSQFIQLLDDWDEKVCKKRPQVVLIKHENGQFIMDTSI